MLVHELIIKPPFHKQKHKIHTSSKMPSESPNFWGDMPEEEYYTSVGVINSKSYFNTPYGKIFTQSFLPLNITNQPIKATVFMTHG